MRSNLTKSVVIAFLITVSFSASATHEGTWHAPDKQAGMAEFCHALGHLAGETTESVCLAVLD